MKTKKIYYTSDIKAENMQACLAKVNLQIKKDERVIQVNCICPSAKGGFIYEVIWESEPVKYL